MKLELVDIDRLVPYEGNPRIEGSDQVERIVESLKGFGFVEPVIAFANPASKDGQLTVIVGHQRLKAAQEKKEKRVPTVIYPFKDLRTALAYNIASNRLGELSSWDHQKLNENFEFLDVGNLDLGLTGFTLEEVEDHVTWTRPDFEKSKGELEDVAERFIERHGNKGVLKVLFFRFEDEEQFVALKQLLTLKGGRECDAAKLWALAEGQMDGEAQKS